MFVYYKQKSRIDNAETSRNRYEENITKNRQGISSEIKRVEEDNHAQPKRVNMEILEIETMSL